eukprot:GGOE01056839.1.p1 GENE.GGOE01056839.1~~GGOE01056839.1.p1  ORF type:complete len:675 (+),score=205.34 GGOE01056839.1:41-2026(+)
MEADPEPEVDLASPAILAPAASEDCCGVAPNVQQVTTFHLPDFVLKIDTHDGWATHSALKKKQCTMPDGKSIRLEQIPGVRRFGKNPSRPLMFVYFESEQQMQDAVPLFEQRATKGKPWTCKACTVDEANRSLGLDKRSKKRAAEGDPEAGGAAKKVKTLEESVTGYAHLPYLEQLRLKQQHLEKVLKAMTVSAVKPWAELRRKDRSVTFPDWLRRATAECRDLCCPLEPVTPSPEGSIDGYRNNTSFTCGYDEEGRDAVGFMRGLYKEGTVAVGHPYHTRHISDLSKHYCAVFQALIDNQLVKGLRCYDKCNHQGFWRRFVVRETVDRDVMLLVQYKPPAEWTTDLSAELRSTIVQHFTTAAPTPHLDQSRTHALKSIHIQEYDGISNAAPPNLPYHLIHGEPFILETCLGMKFRIRPTSFFQVSTRANERLMSLIRELGDINPSTLVLDLCCGTGTIGISLAPFCSRVIGVDMVSDAIADARDNCTLNGITNATFICDKIESSAVAVELDQAVVPYAPGLVVAICDPPRGGLHTRFLQWLRGCTAIQRMVYVSCDQASLIRDTMQLAKPRSNQYTGPPFFPVCARAIDLFPHTDHCEVVAVWQRLPEDDAAAPAALQEEEEAAAEGPSEASPELSPAPATPQLQEDGSPLTVGQCPSAP